MFVARSSRSFIYGAIVFVFVLFISSAFLFQPLSVRLRPHDLHRLDQHRLDQHRPDQQQPPPQSDDDPYGQKELKEYGEDVTKYLSQAEQDAAAKFVNVPRLNVVSNITSNGEYLKVDFRGPHRGYNPSVIPHPYKKEPPTWVLVAQKEMSRADVSYFGISLVCEARIEGDTMRCVLPPLSLPIASTRSSHCVGNGMEGTKDLIGPRDVRVFHGLDQPLLTFVSQSTYTCFGQYFQDPRRLVRWEHGPYTEDNKDFFWPTEVRTPLKPGEIEKNYFLFWDTEGQAYVHNEIKRDHRTFAKLNKTDGTVGPNLAPYAAEKDAKCLAKLMPKINLETKLEYIHQSTNSLLITLCRRTDPGCDKRVDNTFVMTLFNKKSFYGHGMYEPYLMLFNQNTPFEVHGISKRSLWYSGRGRPGGEWQKDTWRPENQTELVFTTTMSWQSHELTYHGYLDDVIFFTFGIEDKRSGIIDARVGDLIADLAYCD